VEQRDFGVVRSRQLGVDSVRACEWFTLSPEGQARHHINELAMGRHGLIKAPLIEWPMSAIGLAGLVAKPPIDQSDLWAPMHPSVNLRDTRKANCSYRSHQTLHTHTQARARGAWMHQLYS